MGFFSFFRKKNVEAQPEPAPPPMPEPQPPPETALAKLQREVFERIIGTGPTPEGLEDWRLGIYAGMYDARTHDALIEDVPHTAKLLGEGFTALVKQYVAEVPSKHHSLAHLGHGFAKWLREHPQGRPDLADLAELEWARSQAFVADDVAPESPESVQQMGPQRFTAATMQFVPSFHRLELAHDVLPLWKAMEEGGAPPEPAPAPTHVLVWRKGFEVFHVAIAGDEVEAMKAAQAGENVAAVCERFASHGDDAAHAAFQAIGSWLTEGMVGALRERPPGEIVGL
jgi:hypothetical protein